jgi:hypothetical protein
LKYFVENPRPRKTQDGQNSASPILTEEQKKLLVERLFRSENGYDVIRVLPEQNAEFSPDHEETLMLLEKLQPDPVENERRFQELLGHTHGNVWSRGYKNCNTNWKHKL